jgi:hypothetical protein
MVLVRKPVSTPADLGRLVDRMFENVMNESERAELLVCIREWESANPEVDAAHRVTGWIDVAYDLRASKRVNEEGRQDVRVAPALLDNWGSVSWRASGATA